MIAVDASFALKLILNEVESIAVRAQWQMWTNAAEVIIAPPLFRAETTSVLRRSVYRGILTTDAGETGFDVLQNLIVEIREPVELYRRAWEIATRFNRPTVYDSCYLALAEIANCELWTADERLVASVRPHLGWVRTVS